MPNPETRLRSLRRIKEELTRLEREVAESGAHALSVLLRAAVSEAADMIEMNRQESLPPAANRTRVRELERFS
jgi:hypothetical protein